MLRELRGLQNSHLIHAPVDQTSTSTWYHVEREVINTSMSTELGGDQACVHVLRLGCPDAFSAGIEYQHCTLSFDIRIEVIFAISALSFCRSRYT